MCLPPSQLALDYGIKFMETSAKANINVENVSPRLAAPAPLGQGSDSTLQGGCLGDWPQAPAASRLMTVRFSLSSTTCQAPCKAQAVWGIAPLF